MIDFTIGITDIIQVASVIVALVVLYVRVTSKMKEMDNGVMELRSFKETFSTRMDQLKVSLADNLVNISNNVASLARQIEDVDKKYVRKDVHDAWNQIINEKLKGVERIERVMADDSKSRRGGRK